MRLRHLGLTILFLMAWVAFPRTAQLASETTRLRTHFDTVDQELRARDVSGLNTKQRATRLTLINWLREYRDAGVFPQNNRFPDRAAPFFRDDRGVLCAMAYLIDRSGRTDIVDQVARTRNNAYIRELADDASLIEWLDDAGLTVAEAARIQPAYGPCGGAPCPAEAEGKPKPVNSTYKVASITTGMASLTTLGLSLGKPSRTRGWAAVVAGSAELIAGATQFNVGRKTSRVSAANVIVGGVAITAGVRALRAAARGGAPPPERAEGKTFDLGPMLGSQRGLQVRITF